MPATSPRKGKSRHSDPSNASITPLTAGFSRISTSSRTQSLSPRKKDAKQGLHIRMNLTETQMDKVTNAYVQCQLLLISNTLITKGSLDPLTATLPK